MRGGNKRKNEKKHKVEPNGKGKKQKEGLITKKKI
jgi:hypothetical protein